MSTVPSRSHLSFYCDFDGTISQTDMIASIMLHFVPEPAEPIIRRILAKELSVKDGVEQLFQLLPSAWYEEVKEYAVRATKIRDGFFEFVDFCQHHGWPLSVVSGGFDFFVYPALVKRRDSVHVFCNSIDTSGEYMRVIWKVDCDDSCSGGCGLCKPTVMRQNARPNDVSVVIGDGVTDLKAARMADYVFATGKLVAECVNEGLSHSTFETFHDIIRVLNTTDKIHV